MESPQHYTLEELLAEAGWARRLAVHLVRDADGADDLLQETWRRALERAPRSDGRSSPRSWIATVLRNLASNWRRDRELRQFHESRALPPDAPHSSGERKLDDVETQLKLQRALADAVLALREPYRTAITLRYLHGLDLREIARRENASYEAVRQRISRGLALLRSELESTRRDDGSSLREFLSAFAVASAKPAWIPALLRKALLVTTKTKLIAAAVAIALLGGAFVWRELRSSAASVERVDAKSTALASNARNALVATAPKPSDSRANVANDAPLATETAATNESLSASIVARIVDEDGAPVDAKVELTSEGGPIELKRTETPPGELRCAATFETTQALARVSLKFDAAGFQTLWRAMALHPKDALDLGAIVLARGAVIRGRVLDADGNALSNARVVWTLANRLDREAARVVGPGEGDNWRRTEHDGSFCLDRIAPGDVRVWAQAIGTRYAFTEPLTASAERPIEGVEIRVEPFARDEAFEILVRRPDGDPFPNAPIQFAQEMPRDSGVYHTSQHRSADESGRAFLGVYDPRSTFEFFASDPSGRLGPAERSHVSVGTTPIELRLTERIPVRLRVFDELGRPVEQFAVSLREPGVNRRELGPDIALALHAGGELELAMPQLACIVDVDAPGFEFASLESIDASKSAKPLEARLLRLAGIRGRVLFEGAPLANATVGLRAAVPEHEVLTRAAVRCRCQPLPTASEKTDSNGEFTLRVRDAAKYFLRADREGLASAELGPLAIEPRVGAENLTLELTRGGSIQGNLLVPEGERASGVAIVASRGDGELHVARVGDDASFRFDELTPGSWLVERVTSDEDLFGWHINTIEYGPIPPPMRWSCEVREGEVTRFDIDQRHDDRQHVHGHLKVSGANLGEWSASLMTDNPTKSSGSVAVGADGEFECAASERGDQHLQLECAPNQLGAIVIAQRLGEFTGTFEWRFELRLGRVRIRNASAVVPGEPMRSILWKNADGVSIQAVGDRLDEHVFEFGAAPVGACRLMTYKSGAEVELARFEVKEGETTDVEMP